MKYDLEEFDPCPPSAEGTLETGNTAPSHASIMALDIKGKYLFVDQDNNPFHSYTLPSDAAIHNIGGYVDKLIKYCDLELLEYLKNNELSNETFNNKDYPILASRSPKLDLQLFNLIQTLREKYNLQEKISLFDLGCTIGEHYTFLDVLFKAHSNQNAKDIINYTGIDKSALLLTVGNLLHKDLNTSEFNLLQCEGSAFEFEDKKFDLSLCIGVVNHVYNPLVALEKLLKTTRYTSVMAIWTTSEEEGFWTTLHSGLAFYFFSMKDLKTIQKKLNRGKFYEIEFIPENHNSQERSYVGLGTEKVKNLGCYHLLYSCLDHPEFKKLNT